MKWSKLNRELIEQVIEKERGELKHKSRRKCFMQEKCPFCPEYYCNDGCPNTIMCKVLDCMLPYDCWQNFCYVNAEYIGLKFRNDVPCKTQSNIEKRLQFWEDALALTKKEFVRKYKKC